MRTTDELKDEIIDIAGELDRRGLRGEADGVTELLAQVVSAQDEVPAPVEELDPERMMQLANELDEAGKFEEADRVTAAARNTSMRRQAQMSPLQQVWQQQPGQSALQAWNPAAIAGKVLNTGYALGQEAYQGAQQLGGQLQSGAIGPLRVQVQQIDQQIAALQQQLATLTKQKQQVQAQGQQMRQQGLATKQPGQQDVSKYNPYAKQVAKQARQTQQVANA